MMKNWRLLINGLLEDGAKVAIVSGGLQQTAKDIAAQISSKPWSRRWGGIDRFTAGRYGEGYDSKLSVFTNGWLRGKRDSNGNYEVDDFGRYQVQMNGKGAIVKMLQRRYGISKIKPHRSATQQVISACFKNRRWQFALIHGIRNRSSFVMR